MIISPLAEAFQNKKGNVIFEITSLGKLQAGTGQNGDWTKKVATIKDRTGEFKITLWNTDINEFENKKFIKLENPFWSEYQGESQLALGKFYKLHEPTSDEIEQFIGKPSEQKSLEDSATSTTKTEKDKKEFVEQATKIIDEKLRIGQMAGPDVFRSSLEINWAKEIFITDWLEQKERQIT